MKPYPRYKPTGLAWLPSVPEHWEVTKIKHLFREVDERNTMLEAPLLSFSRSKGIVPYSEVSEKDPSAGDLSLYKVIRPGLLLENRLQAWSGMFAASNIYGCVSPDYSVFKPSANANLRFYEYVFRSPFQVSQFANASRGVGEGFNRLYTPQFGAILTVLPPPSEQSRIVRYLDEKTAAIDELVRAKERQIELLRERKQALVSAAAVTRGLDPATKLKDSGVSGIGKIPEGWQKDKITRVFSCIGSGTTPPSSDLRYYENGTIPWINSGDLSSGNVFIQSTAKNITRFALDNCPALKMYEGDTIVVAMYGASIGNLGIATFPFCANQACCCLSSPKPCFETRFLYYSLVHCKQMWLEKSKGGTQPNISQNLIRQTWIPFPPLPEQRRIVAHLDSVCADFASAETAIRKQIALLQELRTRLVSDAVTGAVAVG